MTPSSHQSKLGIICGDGDLPLQLIMKCEEIGRPFFLVGFKGSTPSDLMENHDHAWSQLGQVKNTLNLLREAGVQEIVLVGRFRRPGWRELKLDALGIKWVSSMMGSIFGDDALLSTIVHRLESEEGFKVVSAESIVGASLLMPSGLKTTCSPDESDWKDIHQGFKILNKLGEADVGQAVVMQDGLIIAVEAIEGTDGLIERTPPLLRNGPSPILIKSVKPHQERRIDRPTIGPHTIKNLVKSGFKGLALAANEVIVLHPDDVFNLANAHDIFIVGVEVKT